VISSVCLAHSDAVLDSQYLISHICGMTAEQIKKAREHAPFRPFTVFVSDQRRFEIRHPDYVWIVPGGRLIGIADDSGSVELIDLVHVTSLRTNGSAE
jgi:hypothetical protein